MMDRYYDPEIGRWSAKETTSTPASEGCACRRIGWYTSASTKSKGTRCGGRQSARLAASHEAVCDRLCGDARMCCAIEESVERGACAMKLHDKEAILAELQRGQAALLHALNDVPED